MIPYKSHTNYPQKCRFLSEFSLYLLLISQKMVWIWICSSSADSTELWQTIRSFQEYTKVLTNVNNDLLRELIKANEDKHSLELRLTQLSNGCKLWLRLTFGLLFCYKSFLKYCLVFSQIDVNYYFLRAKQIFFQLLS